MELMGHWWYGGEMDGSTLSGDVMGAPTLAPEWERHHWFLRGGGWWEAVADTNYVGDERARIICVGASK